MTITKPDHRQSIEAALALVRRKEFETFDLPCVCAKHDWPYTLRFRRKPGGRYRLVESVRGFDKAASHAPRGSGTPGSAIVQVDTSEFDCAGFPCPWCGDDHINLCSCGAFVCGGLMVSNVFHCRASCGASWIGGPLDHVAGRTSQEPRSSSLRMNAPSPVNAVAASTGKPMLGNGRELAIRKK